MVRSFGRNEGREGSSSGFLISVHHDFLDDKRGKIFAHTPRRSTAADESP